MIDESDRQFLSLVLRPIGGHPRGNMQQCEKWTTITQNIIQNTLLYSMRRNLTPNPQRKSELPWELRNSSE